MEHVSHEIWDICTVFIAAQLAAQLSLFFRQPAVVGQIAVGCLIGPYCLGLLKSTVSIHALSELGAIFLLFSVGLETRLDEMRRVGRTAVLVGVAGVVFPFALALLWCHWQDFSFAISMFTAAGFVATSAGITAQVLKELGVITSIESRVILGAAIVDDILAMLLLGVVTSMQTEAGVDIFGLVLVLAQAVAFVVLVGAIGIKLISIRPKLLEIPALPHSPFVISLSLCLLLAVGASEIGLAAIIGAFLAGLVLAEYDDRQLLERQLQPLLTFLVPFFFVLTGSAVNLSIFLEPTMLFTVLGASLIAIVSKFIAGTLGASNLGRVASLRIGIGMIPRGEVGIIIASLGRSGGVFGDQIFGIIVAMSLITSIVTPPLLKWMFSDSVSEVGLYNVFKKHHEESQSST